MHFDCLLDIRTSEGNSLRVSQRACRRRERSRRMEMHAECGDTSNPTVPVL